jgi:hypothetical protein
LIFGPEPAPAPSTPLWVSVQLYIVLCTLLLRTIAEDAPEQIVLDEGTGVTTGIGLTVIVALTGVPMHPLADGAMLYTACPGVEDAAVSVWEIKLPAPSEAPFTSVVATVQENSIPVTLLVRVIAVVPPEQNSIVAGVAVTSGIGLTVTMMFTGIPLHPFAEGIIVYVTEPGTLPVVCRFCEIKEPVPEVAPETPVAEALHVNVVPPTLPVSPTVKVVPEQITLEERSVVTSGIGFTVITIITEFPMQPLAEGVIV